MRISALSTTLAAAALATSTASHAQQACVAPADLSDMIVYAMPLAYDATMSNCDTQFAADGFMQTNGDGYIQNFRDKQDAAWPGAFRMLQAFMQRDAEEEAESGPDIAALLSNMPEEQIRPFVDGLVTQMIGGEIKPDICGKIERGLELLSPLPVDNTAQLVTFVAELAELKDPAICPAGPN